MAKKIDKKKDEIPTEITMSNINEFCSVASFTYSIKRRFPDYSERFMSETVTYPEALSNKDLKKTKLLVALRLEKDMNDQAYAGGSISYEDYDNFKRYYTEQLEAIKNH